MKALISEIRLRAGDKAYTVHSVFIGGGTPSLMPVKMLEALMETIRTSFTLTPDCEITIEANPGTLGRLFLETAYGAGIRRLSLGLQSAEDEELACLGRIHTYDDFLNSFHMARASGFEHINIDLICGIPGQTPAHFKKTLDAVLKLEPEHLSVYELIVEPGTPFFDVYGQNGGMDDRYGKKADMPRTPPPSWALPLPDEDAMILMDEMLKEHTAAAGYKRYEISNYAKPGKACRHNIGYWRRKPYLGFGTGAAGLMDDIRYKNITDTQTYIRLWQQADADRTVPDSGFMEVQKLTEEEIMEEYMFLGLRMIDGICASDFESRFGQPLEAVYGDEIRELTDLGLMAWSSDADGTSDAERTSDTDGKRRLFLTRRGLDLGNWCMSRFLHDH